MNHPSLPLFDLLWNRVAELVKKFEIAPERFYSILDFYQAEVHLAKVAELRKGWKAPESKNWIKKHLF